MVSAERREATAALDDRERIVADYARIDLERRLASKLEDGRASVERALDNPLEPCADCLAVTGQTQQLPLLAASGVGTPVHDALAEVRAGRPAAAGDESWTRRVELHAGCNASRGVSDLVAHRASFILPIERELAADLALLDDCPVPPTLARGLLRDGVSVPGGRPSEGLQRVLLRDARRLSASDAAMVHHEIVRLSIRHGVKHDDFDARWSELAAAPLDLGALPAPGQAALASAAGRHWVIEGTASGARGVAIDLGASLSAVARRMQRRDLLGPDDHLEVALAGAGAQTLSAARLHLESPEAQRIRTATERRYLVKLGLIVAGGAMAAIIAFLSFALWQRRHRLLAVKSEFIASVSHELRTPLASMRVLAETLERRTAGNERVKDYPARLLRDIDGMSFLVDNILSFNRLDKGRWDVRPQPTSVVAPLRAAVETVGASAPRPIELDARLGDWVLEVDPELVQLLFRNLAANAALYCARDVARLEATREGNDLLLRDNGVGIDANEREAVFEEFQRGAAGQRTRGSGLGLALCRKVMALHGGEIGIVDSGPDGTTFRLRFARELSP